MNAVREIATKMLDEVPDEMLEYIVVYMAYIKSLGDNKIFKELEEASVSSTKFWDNPIDDKAWNDV